MCRTASTTLPEPASPLVRIMAAPSAMRRSASPRFRAPQTKGTRKSCFQTWFSSSAGVRTSLSSIKSPSSACRTSASAKWPIRTLAITGMVTVFMISRITLMEAMRATPPSLRMSEGTRSSGITAQAPAFSAMAACSALVTSIMTPPFNISARPTFTRHSLELPLPLPLTFFASISLLLSQFFLGWKPLNFFRLAYNHKTSSAPREDISRCVANCSDVEEVATLLFCFPAFDNDFSLYTDGLQILHVKFRGYGANFSKAANFPHGFIEQSSNDPTVRHSSAALVAFSQDESPNNLAPQIVLLERQLHSAFVCAAASKASILGIRGQLG